MSEPVPAAVQKANSLLQTPVLFLIFNRPDTTRRVFEEIRKARPVKLFVAADGPRADRPGESDLCMQTRAIIEQVDWKCELHTLFREHNLGCKEAVSSAIDWFFQNVEEGIVLEDDCLPDPSFFGFCQQLLQRYRDDERVMMITGTNFLFNKVTAKESYYFSRYFPVWGWASWQRAWSLYDINMTEWPKYKAGRYLEWLYPETGIAEYLTSSFQKTYEGKIDTWDYQWCYTCIFNHGLCVSPVNNLVSNIGISGTHFTDGSKFFHMPVKSIDVANLTHARQVIPDVYLDRLSFEAMLGHSRFGKMKNTLLEILIRIKGRISKK